MSIYRPNIEQMSGYTPGEQPRGNKVIKLNTNENPYSCSPKVVEAIRHAAEAGLRKYPDPHATAFRIRAAEVLRQDLPEITPDWIICGNGSDDILTILVRTFAGEGDVVRFPRPSYVLYQTLCDIQAAVAEPIDFAPDWTLGPDFTQSRERLRLAFLANSNSPSGTWLSPERVAQLATTLPCPLVVDEAYGDFAPTNCLSLVAQNERVIVTRSLSKSYALAGLRFGFAVAQPEVIAQLNKVKDSYNCDTLALAAATAAIDDQTWLQANRAKILATRSRLADGLAALGFRTLPSHANFVWCWHEKLEAKALYERLKQAGLLVRYFDYQGWEPGLRITVGTDGEIDACLAMLGG
jgi:histidinol-phosphate aminotransferase